MAVYQENKIALAISRYTRGMTLPPAVADYCRANGFGSIRRVTPLGGGCINNASRLDTDNGPLFLKVNDSTPPDMFEREAEGLSALAAPNAIRVPKVLGAGPDFILQEFIEAGSRRSDFWETLGAQLAALHNTTSPQFGFDHDNYIGSTPQINIWEADGHNFFAAHRLRFQAELARRNGRLDLANYQLLITLLSKLPSLIPPQPASLLHGDLWSGNIHTGPNGEPVLIDPAAHYGWAEAELAMMTLFGSPPQSFFDAYESARPLAPGYRGRFDLYNLYHLLNHLNLFGESYGASVHAILQRYA
ncbi:MAG: fructosamine kinase family protein [Chloroflexi bacterium]|nr:fructosamine kinase family protein [Chloroflexota bacterium]